MLRGHLHEGEAAYIRPPDPARACLELAAGCIYDGSRHPNAFQWIELWPEPRRVRVRFRTWVKGAWQIDSNQPGCPEGQADFTLAPKTTPGSVAPATQAPAVPPDYLDWLRRQYESVELLGLDVQAQHSTQLSQVYVPAITPARHAAAPPDQGTPDGRPDDRPQHELLLGRLGEASLYCPGDPGAGRPARAPACSTRSRTGWTIGPGSATACWSPAAPMASGPRTCAA
ncbi:hypothetical protein [uncultured Thiodictyon sp.]|uniref:hypothetical protein n=1 Tax=uncultured Thiodictyon sp. TaxID=1846217 RepID=UPI0025FB253E|nr:hypothetical protein [uncultured Thiodictyon sp.]